MGTPYYIFINAHYALDAGQVWDTILYYLPHTCKLKIKDFRKAVKEQMPTVHFPENILNNVELPINESPRATFPRISKNGMNQMLRIGSTLYLEDTEIYELAIEHDILHFPNILNIYLKGITRITTNPNQAFSRQINIDFQTEIVLGGPKQIEGNLIKSKPYCEGVELL